MHLGMVVGPTYSFTTGSESLHDITMGLFLVAVISRLAGSHWTDDSWQNRPFRGGRPRRREAWRGNGILQVQTLQGRSWRVTDIPGNRAASRLYGHNSQAPFPWPPQSYTALTSFGVRYVQ